MVAVDDEGGGHSMAVDAFNGGDNGRLQGGGKAAGAKTKTQTQQSNKGGGGLRMPSDVFGRAKRRWRGICGMSVMVPRRGFGAAALSGQQQQCICGAQAATHHH